MMLNIHMPLAALAVISTWSTMAEAPSCLHRTAQQAGSHGWNTICLSCLQRSKQAVMVETPFACPVYSAASRQSWLKHHLPVLSIPYTTASRQSWLKHHLPVLSTLYTTASRQSWLKHHLPVLSTLYTAASRLSWLKHHLPVLSTPYTTASRLPLFFLGCLTHFWWKILVRT